MPAKSWDKAIDDSLAILYNAAWVEGSNYKENNPEGSKIPSEREVRKIEAAKQAISTAVREHIIGENQHSEHKEWDCPCGRTHSFTEEWHATNTLRNQQRKALEP